jgi:hypothetical protein
MLVSCGLAMRPVTIETTPAGWQSLDGAWRGEYSTHAYDRHGTIALQLKASREEASAEVLMISDRSGWPYQRYTPESGAAPFEPFTELLTIRIVRARDGQITGHLEPYWDPDRHCQAAATFLGSIDGNRIRGTFTSACDEDRTRILNGRWMVQRKR